MRIIKLSREIYSLNSIVKTKEVYKEYANISQFNSKNNFVLIVFNCKYNEETTIKAFENYLIGVENSSNANS